MVGSWVALAFVVLGSAPTPPTTTAAAPPAVTYPTLAICEGEMASAGWTQLDAHDSRRRTAAAWLRALHTYDARRLADATALPLHVRYPAQYVEQGTRVVYALDEDATTSVQARGVLQELVDRMPRAEGGFDELALLASSGAYWMTKRDGAIVVQVCPAVEGDGVYDTIELMLQHRVRAGWDVHAVEVGWEIYD